MSDIERLQEIGVNDIIYRTSCQCGSDDEILTIWIEYDREDDKVSMSMFYKLHYYMVYNFSDNWFKRQYDVWKRKIKDIFKIIFKGYIEYDGVFMFRDFDHIREFSNKILEGAQKIKKRTREWDYWKKEATKYKGKAEAAEAELKRLKEGK